MFARSLLTIAVIAVCGLYASATDLTAIPRRIAKEPVYHGKPHYVLLVFGTEAKTRIWLVHDGKHAYVDRNGNGDLTDPGEQFNFSSHFAISKLVESPGVVHRSLEVFNSTDETFEMHLQGDRGRRQYVGVDLMDRPTWGTKAENAPIIHFGGPMSLECYGPPVTISRADNGGRRRYSLRLMLGTHGIGKGTFASYDDICSEKLGKLHADIVYLGAQPLDLPLKQRVELVHDG